MKHFEMWLAPIELRSFDGATLRLRAPNSYVRSWFQSNFLSILLKELVDLGHDGSVHVEFDPDGRPEEAPVAETGSEDTSTEVREARAEIEQRLERLGLSPLSVVPTSSSPGLSAPRIEVDATPPPAPVPPPAPAKAAPVAPPHEDVIVAPEAASLNPRYTFDTFVAGPSNQLAFAASQAAGSSYPPKYNPVFVCGGVGLGKTHLLHAIGHQQLVNRPGSRIVYLSSERFMNEYVQAIRTGRMHEFRRNYREGIDVLLVDDVQFLAGKESTQDEFFHTFNALHENHKQIVLTADRKPHEISDIADRLRTRFAWGLLADIEPPELEVRIAILRKKAGVEGVALPDDVALYIASSIKSNVRELEGALIRLAAYASLSKRRIDFEFAQETLGAAITRPREVITVEGVIKAVASYYGLKPGDIKSERRHKSVATPRAVAMYLSRHHTKDSYPDLARAFGGKHHTTVISAVQKIIERLKDDASLRSEVHAIEGMILR
ncbi:MAG: chromosomal replication initiator protein DnaA [Deltaproteobacteria bacterium]|nr:chromosomal replication initiator protein DnaA [Deltaproteobacteria bacterium]